MSLIYITVFISLGLAVPIKDHPAQTLSALVVFGDSISDNGSGTYVLSNETWPLVQHGYYGGRFSNGHVWAEYLADSLNVTLYDHAYGGATTSNAIVQGYSGKGGTIPVPSVDEQVSRFLADPPSIDIDTTLFAVTGGINDLFFNNASNPLVAVSVLAQQIARLKKIGAQHFLLLNYYDVSISPFDLYLEPAEKRVNQRYSKGLQTGLEALHEATNGSVFFSLDTDLFPRLYFYGEPTKYGLDRYGAYGSCLTGIYKETPNITRCDDPDRRVFWDEYHPTTHVHSLIAKGILEKLGAQKGS